MVKLTATSDVFVCGESTVTFNYNGSQVTYGTVVGAAGKCWLDRNLGASQVVTKSNGTEAYGDLFQWGRAADGHQLRNSGTTTDLSDNDTPGHDDFILGGSTVPYDWRNPQNDNLWQGVNGINNPCPAGWRVPTKEEWEAELGIGNKNGSPLNLPAGGYRSDITGAIHHSGGTGYYWSSSTLIMSELGHQSWRMQSGTVMNPSRRADGFSVRCIKN